MFLFYLLKDTPKRWLPFFAVSCSLSFFIRFGNTRLWPAFILLCALIILHMNLLNKSKVKFKPLYFNTALILLVVLIFPYKLLSEINKDKLDKSNLMANFVKERTKEYDTILAYPGDPGLYCLAKRRPASKFYFLAPWLASPEIINTVVRDIKIHKPKMIILRQDFENDQSFSAIHEAIRARYQQYKGREDLSQYAIYELN